jgi:hypothetical protein
MSYRPASKPKAPLAKPLRPVPMTNLGYRVTSGEVRRSSNEDVKVVVNTPTPPF